MKTNRLICLLAFTLLFFQARVVHDDKPADLTAQQVINRYLEAIGGKEKLDQIKDIILTQKVTNPNGETETISKQVNEPGRLVMMKESRMNGFSLSRSISTPDQFVVISPKGTQKVDGDIAKNINQQTSLLIEHSYPVVGLIPVLEGVEEVNGKRAPKVKVTFGAVSHCSLYDCETGMKVKIITDTPQGGTEIRVEDFRRIDSGILFPYKLVVTSRATQAIQTMEVVDIKTNQGLKASDFK